MIPTFKQRELLVESKRLMEEEGWLMKEANQENKEKSLTSRRRRLRMVLLLFGTNRGYDLCSNEQR